MLGGVQRKHIAYMWLYCIHTLPISTYRAQNKDCNKPLPRFLCESLLVISFIIIHFVLGRMYVQYFLFVRVAVCVRLLKKSATSMKRWHNHICKSTANVSKKCSWLGRTFTKMQIHSWNMKFWSNILPARRFDSL